MLRSSWLRRQVGTTQLENAPSSATSTLLCCSPRIKSGPETAQGSSAAARASAASGTGRPHTSIEYLESNIKAGLFEQAELNRQ